MFYRIAQFLTWKILMNLAFHQNFPLQYFPWCSIKTQHSHVLAAKKDERVHKCVIYATGQVADFHQIYCHHILYLTYKI